MLIYLLRNTRNGKGYVGQTKQPLHKRTSAHRLSPGNDRGYSALPRAIAKYGWDAFTVEVLEECEDADDLDMAERFWIATCGTLMPLGYNCETGGNRKKQISESTREKLRAAQARRGPVADQTRQRMSASQKGKVAWNKQLTWPEVREMRRRRLAGEIYRTIGESFGVTKGAVEKITSWKSWRNDPLLSEQVVT